LIEFNQHETIFLEIILPIVKNLLAIHHLEILAMVTTILHPLDETTDDPPLLSGITGIILLHVAVKSTTID